MSDFADLCCVTDAAYQADLARLRRVTGQEATLRAALADLDRQLRDSLGAAGEAEDTWRAVGADEAWRKWLSRQRAEANMQLARILVQKADAIGRLKRSFARRQVSEDILAQQREEARLKRSRPR
jgi:hypothetical protein